MNTLLVATDDWDLILDSNGNIAMAAEPYAIAQDVASAVKTFAGEVYYDTRQGIPYLTKVFGQRPSMQYIKSQIEVAAMTVPGVVSATCSLTAFEGRRLTGNVQVTDASGTTTNVNF